MGDGEPEPKICRLGAPASCVTISFATPGPDGLVLIHAPTKVSRRTGSLALRGAIGQSSLRLCFKNSICRPPVPAVLQRVVFHSWKVRIRHSSTLWFRGRHYRAVPGLPSFVIAGALGQGQLRRRRSPCHLVPACPNPARVGDVHMPGRPPPSRCP